MSFLREAWAKAGNALEGSGRVIRTLAPVQAVIGAATPDPSGLTQGLSIMFGIAGFFGGCAMVGLGKAIQGKELFAPVAKPIRQP